MRKLVGAAVAVAALIPALAVPALAGKLGDKLDQDSDTGPDAAVGVAADVSKANGTGKPGKFTIVVKSKPSGQDIRVGGGIGCTKGGSGPPGANFGTGESGNTPEKLVVKPNLKKAESCAIQANSDFENGDSGKLTATLFHKRR